MLGRLSGPVFADARAVALGAALFRDSNLSADRSVSCQSCHDPRHAYSSALSTAVGVRGQKGTRNAPSLLDAAGNQSYFWDGRRTHLSMVVLDPFTNPVELGLSSTREVLERIRHEPRLLVKFKAAFPSARTVPTLAQVQMALTAFVTSLSVADESAAVTLSPKAARGKRLFEGDAGCAECHSGKRLTDDGYHHSGIGRISQDPGLASLVRTVVKADLNVTALGPKVLSNRRWSALGRFNVTHKPADIGAFRTPSLCNVAITAPYMHDGSIKTLSDAVDQEIYYRGLSRGKPINLSSAERAAIVVYLESLTDRPGRTQAGPQEPEPVVKSRSP